MPPSRQLVKDLSYDQCSGIGCETIGQPGKRLSACGGCGIARYCSKECQKKDWKYHKPTCKSHRQASALMSQKSSNENSYMRVSKWIMKHRPSLADAMVCAFDIPHNPRGHTENLLDVSAKYLPDQDDEHCLVITNISRSSLASWRNMSDQMAQMIDARENIEMESLRADPDMYGTGFVMFQVWHEKDLLFMRALPMTFDKEMAAEVVPERDAEWQDVLLEKTGCMPLIRAGLAHTCCAHCTHDGHATHQH